MHMPGPEAWLRGLPASRGPWQMRAMKPICGVSGILRCPAMNATDGWG